MNRFNRCASWLLLALSITFPGLARAADAAEATAAASPALDYEALMEKAMVSAPDLASAARSLASAEAKALGSLAIWKSSVSGTGAWKGTAIEDTTSAGPGGSTTGGGSASGSSESAVSDTYSVSVSLSPLDQLSLQASLDSARNLKASATVSPFASTASSDSAWQALEDQRLAWSESRRTVSANIKAAYGAWAKTWAEKEIALLDRDAKATTLSAEEIRHESGASSASALDTARNDWLTAFRTHVKAVVAEEEARTRLLLAAGLDLATTLAPPSQLDVASLLARAGAILEARTPPRGGTALTLAQRAWERARASAAALPDFLSGLSLGGGVSGTTTALDWNASVTFRLGADTFNGNWLAERERNLATARANLEKAEAQESLDTALAFANLEAAVAMAKVAIKQSSQADAVLKVQETLAQSGGLSKAGLLSWQISARKSRVSMESALWDLDAALASWDSMDQ